MRNAHGERVARARPKQRREQLSDEVAGHLRVRIMSGTLRPGTFIRLDETAAELGVSITPVREALRTLRGEGMVQLEPHRGHVVSPLHPRRHRGHLLVAGGDRRANWPGRRPNASPTRRSTNSSVAGRWPSPSIAADTKDVVDAEFAFHRAFNRRLGTDQTRLVPASRGQVPAAAIYAADPLWGARPWPIGASSSRRCAAATSTPWSG